ncbi:MAG TPA: UDP-2,3-diacylglucosamine diphosphatase, partial [Ignavibacteria bacterium]|nr:UDP-2,3-diacylglucosamine diphosphatase [Ignavibacteria bacterium]
MDEKKYYFFSDVHLGFLGIEEEKLKERKLVSFLESIRSNAREIYIVGDLFDCWIEYRRAVPKGFYRTLAKLNEIAEQGIPVNFFSGNHDFWMNTYLRDDVGLKLYSDSLETTLDGKRFFITHGDGLSKGDTGYKILKKILRCR